MPCNAIIVEMGLPFFHKLQQHFGGLELKLPKTPGAMSSTHHLVIALGRDDADRLAGLMQGEPFYVPRGYRDYALLSAVSAELEAGTSTQDMAAKLGVSARHIRRLKQRAREEVARRKPSGANNT